jgi:hypothetical protein
MGFVYCHKSQKKHRRWVKKFTPVLVSEIKDRVVGIVSLVEFRQGSSDRENVFVAGIYNSDDSLEVLDSYDTVRLTFTIVTLSGRNLRPSR